MNTTAAAYALHFDPDGLDLGAIGLPGHTVRYLGHDDDIDASVWITADPAKITVAVVLDETETLDRDLQAAGFSHETDAAGCAIWLRARSEPEASAGPEPDPGIPDLSWSARAVAGGAR